jgi:hypothetical protein
MPGKRMKAEYVTKPQLDEALAAQDQRFDAKLEKLEAKLDVKLERLEAKLDAKLDAKLGVFGNAILDRMDRLKTELSAELASHIKASQEYVAAQIKVVDEKYADLPGRVAALEARSTP